MSEGETFLRARLNIYRIVSRAVGDRCAPDFAGRESSGVFGRCVRG